MSLQLSNADVDRFVEKVEFPEDESLDDIECWIWTGAHHSKQRGYGKFRLLGKVMNAHKAAYLLFKGPVPEGMVIGHLCNRESCVNPAHLVAQSQAENMQYAVACGRHHGGKH